jgi:putative MATE family efflux protein
MGLPSMFGFLVQHVYILADTWWVSRLPAGEAAVAGITFVSNLTWVIFSFNALVGPGSVAVISRRFGQGRRAETRAAILEAIVLKLALGSVFGLVGAALVEPVLVRIGASGDALALGVAYGRIHFLGLPIMFATYTIFTALRGVGNPNLSFVLMFASNLLNMTLDPLLIFGKLGFPALGIAGAAVASVTGFTITFAAGLVLFGSGRANVRLRWREPGAYSRATMTKMVRIGVPVLFGDLSFSGARLVVTTLVAPFGTLTVAAWGVANQVTALGVTIVVGIGLGLSALIGHLVGAGMRERARRTGDVGVALGVIALAGWALLAALAAGPIFGLFFDDPGARAVGVPMLRILAIGFPFIGAFLMMMQVFGGVGLNTPTMIFNVVHAWVLQVMPILLLTGPGGAPATAIWWTMSAAEIVNAIGFWWVYRRGRWLDHSV